MNKENTIKRIIKCLYPNKNRSTLEIADEVANGNESADEIKEILNELSKKRLIYNNGNMWSLMEDGIKYCKNKL